MYRELETEGWVTTGRARGTIVADAAPVSDPDPPLRAAAAEFVAVARGLGADEEAAVAVVREAYRSP